MSVSLIVLNTARKKKNIPNNMAKCRNISSEFQDKRKHKIPRKGFCEIKDEEMVIDKKNLRIDYKMLLY